VIAFDPGDQVACVAGEVLRRVVRGVIDQLALACEQFSLDRVVEPQGGAGEGVGVLGGDPAVGQRLTERRRLGEQLAAPLAQACLGGRQLAVA
jgi:hypothetical protein